MVKKILLIFVLVSFISLALFYGCWKPTKGGYGSGRGLSPGEQRFYDLTHPRIIITDNSSGGGE